MLFGGQPRCRHEPFVFPVAPVLSARCWLLSLTARPFPGRRDKTVTQRAYLPGLGILVNRDMVRL
jgi:hypothetical protein